MADIRMAPSVRSVVRLEAGPNGRLESVEVYRRPDEGRRKGTRLLRPVDRAVKRLARAQEAAATAYLERHDRSNTKKRDGWLRDIGNNVYRASRKGQKALKLERLLFP
jgi:hypothetical protein